MPLLLKIILIALGALAFAAWYWWRGIPELTDEQITELVNEYRDALRLRDEYRATEILVDLRREGVTVRHLGNAVLWERD